MCHGVNGDPEMAGAADLRRGQGLMQSDDQLLERIKRGNRACPAFLGILRDQEILDLIGNIQNYLNHMCHANIRPLRFQSEG